MADNEYFTKDEFTQYSQRIDAENDRQNHRIQILENKADDTLSLVTSVEKLANSLQNMVKEQERQSSILEKQGTRLEKLENRDGEMWRKVVSYSVTAVVGVIIGFIFVQIGI